MIATVVLRTAATATTPLAPLVTRIMVTPGVVASIVVRKGKCSLNNPRRLQGSTIPRLTFAKPQQGGLSEPSKVHRHLQALRR